MPRWPGNRDAQADCRKDTRSLGLIDGLRHAYVESGHSDRLRALKGQSGTVKNVTHNELGLFLDTTAALCSLSKTSFHEKTETGRLLPPPVNRTNTLPSYLFYCFANILADLSQCGHAPRQPIQIAAHHKSTSKGLLLPHVQNHTTSGLKRHPKIGPRLQLMS